MRTMRTLAAVVGTCAIIGTCVTAASADEFLFDAIKKPESKKALLAMLHGAKDLPPWVSKIGHGGNFFAAPAVNATVGGELHVFYSACEAKDCAGSRLEIMFSSDGKRAFGMLADGDKPPRWFGTPDTDLQAALTKASTE
jgi:hypothetical protein